MNNLFHYRNSLFLRLSMALLVLLVLLGLAYVLITAYAAREYYQETTQRLNAEVAEHLLHEVTPFVDGEVNEEALGKIMHSMMAVNPSLEVYLLDPEGQILSFVVFDKKVRLKNVSLEPIQRFIASGGEEYVLGDDPRNPGEEVVFSATPAEEEGKLLGYVYMVLASEKYEHASEAFLSSYFMKVGTGTFVVTLVAAFGLGLLLIALLTRNLRKIRRGVKQFENGDYQARIPVEGTGELADLAKTFNDMADTILRNIDELKEVDRLRRDLIANVSHDLRSPLSVIHGYIETLALKQDKLSAEEQKRYLDIILKSSEKLKKLVADLFELTRLEAHQVTLRQEPFFVNELLLDAARQYELMASKKHVDLQTELPEKLPMVVADIDLIGRVIQNLLDNALKFTPEQGAITLKAEVLGDHISVEVSNSGEGIPEDVLPNIFDRYYKVDHSQNGITGSGLGLAIVKKIIDLHGADIRVTSAPEAPTRFVFTLPLAA